MFVRRLVPSPRPCAGCSCQAAACWRVRGASRPRSVHACLGRAHVAQDAAFFRRGAFRIWEHAGRSGSGAYSVRGGSVSHVRERPSAAAGLAPADAAARGAGDGDACAENGLGRRGQGVGNKGAGSARGTLATGGWQSHGIGRRGQRAGPYGSPTAACRSSGLLPRVRPSSLNMVARILLPPVSSPPPPSHGRPGP